ncbi:MAG: four helix bundle protein [Acidobacteria bacterium]|nr:four helix bundle protein [Acidobacteriota bacterium]
MYRFERLVVWQKSIALCGEVYRISAAFPKEELYGLTSQLRRAAVSIPTNIAEGTGDPLDKEFVRFLRYALRSEHEVASLLKLAVELRFLTESRSLELLESVQEIGKMLQALIRKLQSADELHDGVALDIGDDLHTLLTTDD